jgi:acyl carrier protein
MEEEGMLTRSRVIDIVRRALDSPDVTDASSRDNLPGWDSLAHLNVLTAIDEATQGRASDLSELADAQSVKRILEILAARSLLAD